MAWISFAWTTPALLAGRKTVTRRLWDDRYAERFILAWRFRHPVTAYDKNPRNGGTKPSIVLDPFGGSGTTGKVSEALGRDWIIIEISEKYVKMSRKRTATTKGMSL